MRAATVVSHDGPSAVVVADVEEPSGLPDLLAGLGDPVTIDVRAAAVSFPDVLQCWGRYQDQPPMPFVPGIEVSGVVVMAPQSSRFVAGDQVAAFTGVGGLAERALAPETLTFALPPALSFPEGAALVANYHTAYFSLMTRGRYREGEVVLVQGAAGGIGTAAIQIAAGVGARVLAVVSDDRKADVARVAGAHEVYLTTPDWKGAVLSAHPDGVDIVLDPVGGDRMTDNLRVLREDGRVVVIGFAAGGIPEFKANRLLLKNISAVGAGWGSYAFSRPTYVRQVADALATLIGEGHVRPLVGATFPLEQVGEAFHHIDRRLGVGKIVVTT